MLIGNRRRFNGMNNGGGGRKRKKG